MNNVIIKPINVNGWCVFAEEHVRILNCELNGTSWFGLYSYINNGIIRSYSEIGRFCSIGRNVSIGLGVHDYNNFSTHPLWEVLGSKLDSSFVCHNRRVIIGNDVWIGDRVLINSGVRLGDGCVVAAGSVVVKDVPPYAIVGGIPAKIIKYRFPDNIIEKLMYIKWWNYSIEQISVSKSQDIYKFIEKIESLGEPQKTNIRYEKFTPSL